MKTTPVYNNSFDNDKSTSLKIDFIGKRHIFYILSAVLILAGIIVSIPTIKLDIQFTGGAIFQYTLPGEADAATATDAAEIAQKTLDRSVTGRIDTDYSNGTKILVLQAEAKRGQKGISADLQTTLFNALSEKYSGITRGPTNVVDPSMGAGFLRQSVLAVVLACVLILVYIWFRFRKIGGLPAGLTALAALAHDVLIVFASFAIFQIPLSDTFIAVTLTILGYSINDTIVVYDRIRENRTIFGNKYHFKDIVNRSINQSFVRSINTTLCTFVAIAVVCAFSIVFHLDTIRSFAIPMMVGVVTGCYSTICIAGPLWVTWVTYKEKKNPPKAAGKKKLTPKNA